MHFLAEPPLRPNAVAIADHKHPDHQLGINRRPPDTAVERRQLLSDLAKIDKPIYRPQQMVSRNMSFERELIEQSSLFDLPMSHHDSQSCFSQRLNQRISCLATEDFFNTIGQ